MAQAAAQTLDTPNALSDRVGAMLDPSGMLAKAEAALQDLASNFAAWLSEEVGRLEAARESIRAEGVSAENTDHLFTCAHDLKGLGATYEFPLVTRLAASLCKLINDPATRQDAPMFLIDAHIGAIKAAVRDNVRSDTHPVGRVLAEELESRVYAFAA